MGGWGGGGWKRWETESEKDGGRERERGARRREHGKAQLRSESARLEPGAKNKAASDFHFFTLCLLYIVRRRVPLFSSLEIKEL